MDSLLDGTLPVSANPSTDAAAPLVFCPDPGAVAWTLEPFRYFTRAMLRNGEVPLWAPHSFLGRPHLGCGQVGVFDPLNWPAVVVSDSLYAWVVDLEILVRYLIAGFFTFLFLQRLRLSFGPALFGAAAYMFSNHAFYFVNHADLHVFTLLPLTLYCVHALALQVSFRHGAQFSACVAWLLFADFAEATFVVLQFAGLWFLCVSAVKAWETGLGLRGVARDVAWFVASCLLGFALGAPVLFPFLENVAHGFSAHDPTEFAGTIRAEPYDRICAFIPYYLTRAQRYYPNYHLVVWPLAVAALLAVFKNSRRRAAVVFFGAYGAFFLLKQYGFPGTNWLGTLPVYRQVGLVRYTTSTIEFSFAALGACGLSLLLSRQSQIRTALSAIAATVLMFVYTLSLIPEQYFSTSAKMAMACTFALSFLCAPIAVLVMGGAIRLPRRVFTTAVILLLVCELQVAFYKSHRPLRHDPYAPAMYVKFLQAQDDCFRTYARDSILYPEVQLAYGIDDVRHVSSVLEARKFKYSNALLTPNKDLRIVGTETEMSYGPCFDLLNIRYFIVLNALPPGLESEKQHSLFPGVAPSGLRFERVYDGEVKIFRNANAFPRAFIVYAVEHAQDPDEAVQLMRKPDWSASRIAIVDGPATEALTHLNEPSDPVPATVINRSANSMTVRAASGRPGLLVVSDACYPGWKAYLDGSEVPIFPTDVMLRGIQFPAGEHTVQFKYQPESFTWGLYLAGAAAVLLLCGAGINLWRGIRAHVHT